MTLARGATTVCSLLLLLVIPLVLSNNPQSTALSSLICVVCFFFPGYLLLACVASLPAGLRFVLSPVFGIVCVTTAYDISARASAGSYFFPVVTILSVAGVIVFATRLRRDTASLSAEDHAAFRAGSIVALGVGPLYWRSGRFSGTDFVFHGPAGQDHLFHVSLLQRLLQHVPPDNFLFAGLRPSVYHYFGDQAIAFVLVAQHVLRLGSPDLFDVYYRCYPTLVYFLIGTFAYIAGRNILGTTKGGSLGVLLLLGGGGLGWIAGILQTAVHAAHFAAVRERLFSSWTAWDGVDAIRPLIHRPAHYHSLMIGLSAVCILLQPLRARSHWVLAGMLLGLMAGFNFTVAATFGGAALLGSLFLLLRERRQDARDLAWLALFIFLGSLPVNAEMLLAGFHNSATGFPFRGLSLEFPTSIWGIHLGKILPAIVTPLASLLLFPIVAYGLRLFALPSLVRLDLEEDRHRGLAMLLAFAFALSFAVGTFFPYRGFDAGIIFLQPTFWILALFSLRAIGAWLERHRMDWSALALWGILGLTWTQAFLAFNVSYKVVFNSDTVRVLQDVRRSAAPDDVLAYLPSEIAQRADWGPSGSSTNFAITAMTGLDGYFSSEDYSRLSEVPGLSGESPEDVLDKAKRLYQQRLTDVGSFIRGDMTDAAYFRLKNDRVRWIVVFDSAMQRISTPVQPWQKTQEIAVFRLSP